MYPYDNSNHLYIIGTEHYEFASRYCKGKVLDVGCGLGALIPYLNDVDYTGIDATKWVAEKANDVRITFNDVMFYDGYFDTVCALGVLDTAIDLKPLADKLKSLGDLLIFSFREGNQKSKFKQHSKNDIINAFGNVEFHKAIITDETYCIYRKIDGDRA